LLHEVGSDRAAELGRYQAVIHLRTPSLAEGYNHRHGTAESVASVDECPMAWTLLGRRVSRKSGCSPPTRRISMLRKVTLGLVLGLALATTGSFALAAEPKIPSTPEEHFALAKDYAQKAETYRKEAAEHKKMGAAYRNSPANASPKARGDRNPAVETMDKHCTAIVNAAEKLAVENEKAADYHTLRGKELQGK
jgi:hypothetical protein